MSNHAENSFINILDHDSQFLATLIDKAVTDKALFRKGNLAESLHGKTLAMYFEKPSLRTRLSFEVAMAHLAGTAIYLTDREIGLGKREPIKDVARVVSGMCDGFVARTFSHESIEEFAKYASIPVINALTDFNHPCQVMADMMTIKENFGKLAGLKLTYIGDGNNVARSLAAACERFAMDYTVAAPKEYQLRDDFLAELDTKNIRQTDNPEQAAENADVIYTDTWTSMGQEEEKQKRISDFRKFQVTSALVAKAKQNAIVMHCLPAYREFEITDEVIESKQSVVFQQAENRLHFQRTLLAVLMTG